MSATGTSEKATGRIVVGVDGSESSRRALRWAVNEARARNLGLLLVTGWSYEPPDVLGEFDERAQQRLDDAEAEARQLGADLDVTTAVVPKGAAEALIGESQGAEMLVVGSRGRGGFAGLLLGSVGQQCAHHAACPVVIVPGHDGPRTALS